MGAMCDQGVGVCVLVCTEARGDPQGVETETELASD